MSLSNYSRNPIIKLSVLFIILFSSCRTKTADTTIASAPEALTEKSSISAEIKRTPSDLVQALYIEMVNKSPALKSFENDLEQIGRSTKDSTEEFNNFDQKNMAYYLSAERHLTGIKDSLLRVQIQDLLKKSEERYNLTNAAHRNLLKSIDTKKIRLNDLHELLKISLTVPLIEQFQQSDLPPIKPLEKIAAKYDQIIFRADSILKN